MELIKRGSYFSGHRAIDTVQEPRARSAQGETSKNPRYVRGKLYLMFCAFDLINCRSQNVFELCFVCWLAVAFCWFFCSLLVWLVGCCFCFWIQYKISGSFFGLDGNSGSPCVCWCTLEALHKALDRSSPLPLCHQASFLRSHFGGSDI